MTEKKLVRSKSGLRTISVHEDYSAFTLEEPQWIPDKECAECRCCHTKFDFLRRRHHCRRCGHIFCAKCCVHLVQLRRMGFVDPVRHCDFCAKLSNVEANFYGKDIKVLMAGARFEVVTDSGSSAGPHVAYVTSNERTLKIEGKEDMSVDLKKLVGSTVLTETKQGDAIVSGMRVHYRSEESEQQVTLNVVDAHHSIPWIKAMQKALRIIIE